MNCAESIEVFLSTGVTRSCLRVAGNRVDGEVLTTLVSISENAGRDITSCVGTGSRAHCLSGQRPKVRPMCCTVTGLNDEMRQSVGCRTTGADSLLCGHV